MARIAQLALLTGTVGLLACGHRRVALSPTPEPAVPPGFDHVVVAIDSLERGIALLREATGVTPRLIGTNSGRGGGADPGVGSRSAIIGLGPGRFLELVAPAAPDSGGAPNSASYAIYHTLTPIGWAMRTPDSDSLRAALTARALRVQGLYDGERRQPDGKTVRWRVIMPWFGISTVPPFFVDWDRSAGAHPSADAPSGCTLTALTLAYPPSVADTLRAQLARAGVHAIVTPASRQSIDLTLDCPTGRVTLPGGRG